ncbi:Type I phosphodiesterase / nucleotide pyrophosphatase [Duganella sp. CF402]|uniref:tetratricopeptide repeat protein n=1 Tax=unclassified Duganella TaxID=2636909 RepID=UPI0008C15C02|nr:MULTISPECIES: tetratricopeptide repeat protein [unclassified Duganella]SEL45989.1 Type I phosphodiesterase / nucleotide pyrophosphatase [Duganella sp. CF402]
MPSKRFVMLAIDGMDWHRLQQLADRGLLPMISSLIEAGACGWLDFPPSPCADSGWASVASGVLPDRHGLLHALAPLPQSLFLRPAGDLPLRTPAVWHWADDAGLPTAVVGWPATHGLQLRHGYVLAAGLEAGLNGDGWAWPLAPQAVHPPALRDLVHEARVAPDEIRPGDTDFLLAGFPPATRALLAAPMAAALAQCATLHALGTAMIEQHRAGGLVLRLKLPAAVQALLAGQADTAAVELSIARSYQFLDLICGRYFQLLGPATAWALMSNGAGLNDGFVVMAGPGIARDRNIGSLGACDVLPTLAAGIGLPVPANLDGDPIDEVFASPRRAVIAASAVLPPPLRPEDIPVTPEAPLFDTQLFEREGLPMPDYAVQQAFAAEAECATLFALATTTIHRGLRAQAIAQLRRLATRFPHALNVRVSLAEQLLLAGELAACEALVSAFPLLQLEQQWADAVYGILALLKGDHHQAQQRLTALTGLERPPVNPHLWLGRMHQQQSAWPQALASFEAAVIQCPQDAETWLGLGRAAMKCGTAQKAVEAFGHAVSLQPRSAEALSGLAAACEASGDHARAASARTRAMRCNPATLARSLGA